MRLRLIIFTVIILFSVTFQFSFAQPSDVEGWNKAKWGMTEDEIKKTFQGQVRQRELSKTPIYCSTLQIDNIKLVDKQFEAVFLMNCDTKKLKSVTIRPSSKWSPSDNLFAFDRLREELIKKYGEPRISKMPNKYKSSGEIIWIFPSTEITLSFFMIEDISIMGLNYKQNENQELL